MSVEGQAISQSQSGSSASPATSTGVPLIVDLDGTVIATDLFWESLVRLLKQRPWLAVLLPVWLMHGRAVLKEALARRVTLAVAALPYREAVLSYLRQQKAAGRRLVLATGSAKPLADRVAAHLGLFDAVLASDGGSGENLTAERKRAAIEASEGGREFDYLGDHPKDLAIWSAARQAHFAGRAGTRRKLEATVGREREGRAPLEMGEAFAAPSWSLRTVARAIRVHQWIKNVLLLVPLLLAHELMNPASVAAALLAMLGFSLVASSVYLVNDLLDVESDRLHATKRDRPIASGELPMPVALALVPGLLAAALALSGVFLPALFTLMLGAYFVLALAYTIWLKQRMVLDVLVLAGFYAYRVLSGAVAISVFVSPWLLAFSMFFFLSLAFVKRYADLDRYKAAPSGVMHGRNYGAEDLELFRSLGPTVGYLSVLVLAMYISSDRVMQHYGEHPQTLWLVCPLLLYWITRIWFITHRGRMSDDPIVFTLKDPVSYVIGALIFTIGVIAAS